MPRGRRSRNVSQAIADDEEPPSQSQSQSQRRQLPEADAARLAQRVVRYVLAAHGRGEPLRRDKIRKHALEPQHAGCMQQILQAADLQLRDVFGMSLEVLPSKRGELLLVNRLPVGPEPLVRQQEAEMQRHGLLVAVLALIFMSNDLVSEDTLWRFLEKLGVRRDEPHECFGNVKKLVTEDFKRAGYLKTTEVKQKDQVALLFHWGDAAELVVNRMELLKFVCGVWDDKTRPEDWPEQHQRALRHQRELEQQQQQMEE